MTQTQSRMLHAVAGAALLFLSNPSIALAEEENTGSQGSEAPSEDARALFETIDQLLG